MSPKTLRVVAGVALQGGKVLMGRRCSSDTFCPGYWEFPGGKVEAGETDEAALTREFQEELGCKLKSIEPLESFIWEYPTRSVDLHFYWVEFFPEFLKSEISSSAHDELRWIAPATSRDLKVLPANRALMERILKKLEVENARPNASLS